MNIRQTLADGIDAAKPRGWKVYSYATVPDTALKPVVVVRQNRIVKTPGAPRKYQDLSFSVCLLEPNLDPKRVEDALDADVETLIDILDSLDLPGLVWREAQRVTFEDQYPGYEITLTITTEKDDD